MSKTQIPVFLCGKQALEGREKDYRSITKIKLSVNSLLNVYNNFWDKTIKGKKNIILHKKNPPVFPIHRKVYKVIHKK